MASLSAARNSVLSSIFAMVASSEFRKVYTADKIPVNRIPVAFSTLLRRNNVAVNARDAGIGPVVALQRSAS
jgi:hypothetical protein